VQIFNGKEHAQILENKIVEHLKSNPAKGILAIIQIGNNPSSSKYVQIKKTFCRKVGVPVSSYQIDEDLDDESIFSEVIKIFKDRNISGGIVQIPLPRKSLNKVLKFIPVSKDVDLISEEGTNEFYNGDLGRVSPVIRAIKYFLEVNKISLRGLRVTIIGDGELVGRPVAFFLSRNGAKVDVLANYDGERKINCQLLVLSAGVPNLVKGESICEKANVIDFGSSIVEGKYVGDLDLHSDVHKFGILSPSPGGLGPLVVRFLVMNHLGI